MDIHLSFANLYKLIEAIPDRRKALLASIFTPSPPEGAPRYVAINSKVVVVHYLMIYAYLFRPAKGRKVKKAFGRRRATWPMDDVCCGFKVYGPTVHVYSRYFANDNSQVMFGSKPPTLSSPSSLTGTHLSSHQAAKKRDERAGSVHDLHPDSADMDCDGNSTSHEDEPKELQLPYVSPMTATYEL